MLRSVGILLVLTCCLAAAYGDGYDGHKIYEVTPTTGPECDLLYELSQQKHHYDFLSLSKVPQRPARVMVHPSAESNFLGLLQQHGLQHRMLNANVGQTIKQEFEQNRRIRRLVPITGKGRLSTDRYYTHAEINAYIGDLAVRYPTRVFVETVGISFEGRDMNTITITNGDGRTNKGVILLTGGIHGSEWMSPAVVLYAIDQLVENFAENAELLQDRDWVILPVVNPDGYEYTQTSIAARLFSKTRQPYRYLGQTCYGADPDRNFDFHWNDEGVLSLPCEDIYAGPQAFSEPETAAVRDLVNLLKDRGVMYLSFRSFGQHILYPWGFTSVLPDNWEELAAVGRAGADAIFESTGDVYQVASASEVLNKHILERLSDAVNWVLHEGFNCSFTLKLPDFLSHPELVLKYGKGTWIGIKAMAETTA